MAPCSRNLFVRMAITDLPGVVASLQLKRLLKAFGCPDRTEFWPKFPHKRSSVYPYTEYHRPVGLQAGITMETAGLVVHLHVHVDLLFFCKLWRIMRDCFHTETSVALKMCLFLHIFFKILHNYLCEPICLKISPQTLHRLGMMSCKN